MGNLSADVRIPANARAGLILLRPMNKITRRQAWAPRPAHSPPSASPAPPRTQPPPTPAPPYPPARSTRCTRAAHTDHPGGGRGRPSWRPPRRRPRRLPTVRIDGRELHVMRNADGTWISVVNHYETFADPASLARAAVRELQGAVLAPFAPMEGTA
nr:ORF 1 [Streptomyces lavendulae]